MLKSNLWRVLLVLCLILAGAAIAVASLYPRLQLQLPWGASEGNDLISHGAAYGVLVILGGVLWHRLRWVALVVLLYSTLLEGLQHFVPGREFFFFDLAANVAGILVGLAAMTLWRFQKKKRLDVTKDGSI